MRIPHKTKLLLAISIGMIVFAVGCVDTSVQPIPGSIDYSSQFKVVNLVSGAGTAALTLNGQSLGSVDFGSEIPGPQSAFLTIPAGNKTLSASFATAANKSFQFAAITDSKFRIFLVGTAASNDLVTKPQRYIWQTPGSDYGKAIFPADTGQVAFFNGSPDAVVNSINIDGNTTTFANGLEMGEGNGYLKVAAGSYDISFNVTFSFAPNDSTTIDSTMNTIPFNYTIGSKGRYTTVLYDSATTLKSAVFVDD